MPAGILSSAPHTGRRVRLGVPVLVAVSVTDLPRSVRNNCSVINGGSSVAMFRVVYVASANSTVSLRSCKVKTRMHTIVNFLRPIILCATASIIDS